MQFRSGHHMPLTHVLRWSFSQLVLLTFFVGPWVFIALFLTGHLPTLER